MRCIYNTYVCGETGGTAALPKDDEKKKKKKCLPSAAPSDPPWRSPRLLDRRTPPPRRARTHKTAVLGSSRKSCTSFLPRTPWRISSLVFCCQCIIKEAAQTVRWLFTRCRISNFVFCCQRIIMDAAHRYSFLLVSSMAGYTFNLA